MGNEAVPKNDESQNVRIATVGQAESRVSQPHHSLYKGFPLAWRQLLPVPALGDCGVLSKNACRRRVVDRRRSNDHHRQGR